MSEWKEIPLKIVLGPKGYIRGPFGSSLKRGEMKSEGIPVYEQKNVIYNERSFRFFIDEEKFKDLSRFQVKTNDLMISCSGTVGKISIIKSDDPKGIISQALLILRPDTNKIELLFLYYYLSSKQGLELITQASHGSVQINIAERKVVENIPVPFPPLSEQKAIAAVLSCLDDKIDLLHRQNKTLESMAEALFKKSFVDEADEEWEKGTIADLCQTITKGTTPTTLGHCFTEVGVNFVKAESITDAGDFIWDKFAKISIATHEFLNRSILQEGDVLCSIAGTIGRVAIATKEILPANTNQAIAIIRVNREKGFPEFIYLFLKSPQFKEIMDGKIVHAVQPNLSLGEIANTPISIPPKQKMDDFCLRITPLFSKIKINTQLIRTLEKLRDTLLPKLMSGEVRISI